MATDKVKVIKVDTDAAQKSVKDLRKELKELRNTLLSTEEGTEEYNQALQAAADIQHTLKEQMEEINANAMDFGQVAGNVVKATGGLVAGFQAAQAAMNLFGVENEEVIKAMQKMQSFMAITQAIPAIDESVKAFKRLRLAILGASAGMSTLKKALISTGIGAVVALLGTLIANWDKVTEAVKRFTNSNYEAEKSQRELAKTIEQTEKDIAVAQGKLEEWEERRDYNKFNKATKEAYDEYKEQLEGVQLQLTILRGEETKAEAEYHAGAQRRASGSEWKQIKQNYENAVAARRAAEAQVNELNQALKNLRESESSYTADVERDTTASAVKVKTDKERVKTLEELNAEMDEWLQKQMTAASTHDDMVEALKQRKLAEKELKEIEEEQNDDAFLQQADNYRRSVESIVESLRSLTISEEDRYIEEQTALDVALHTKLISIQDYYRLSEVLAKEHNEKQRQLALAEAQVWMSSLQNIGNVFSSMADMIDTSTEEGEEKYKALMYTSTVVSMLAGIGGAIASAFNPANAYLTIWGQIAMAATTSASVLASGIAQLIQIKNANKNSSLGGSGGFASPSTSSVGSIIAPVQYTQDVQGASIEGAIKDSKVYVTETDITDTQKRVSVSEEESKY